jgi:Ricin-type beta-trefoil lectin domain
VEEPTSERQTEPARPKLARALTATIRRPGDKGTIFGRVLTAGLAVVLTCAVAMGVGAVAAHNTSSPKTTGVAAQRSLSASRSPSAKTARPSSGPKKYVFVPGAPGAVPAKSESAGKGAHPTSGAHAKSKKTSVVTVSAKTIVNYASGKCIDVTHEGQTGVPLQIWTCGPVVDWKLWAFYPDHTVRSMGKCMTVARSANGTPIELEPCRGGATQRFVLKSSLDLVNIATDKCVDVKDKQTANGTPLQLWSCQGTSNQKWHTG